MKAAELKRKFILIDCFIIGIHNFLFFKIVSSFFPFYFPFLKKKASFYKVLCKGETRAWWVYLNFLKSQFFPEIFC